jgi:hypothetical protein
MEAAFDQCQLRKRATHERNVNPGIIKKEKNKVNGPSIE